MVRRAWPVASIALGFATLFLTGFMSLTQGSAQPRPAPPATARIIDGDWFQSPPPAPSDLHQGFRVQVPSLGIDLAIVEGDGVTAPLNLAAHYPGMKWPGEGGRSLIYAHGRVGMFGPLFRAHAGQEVVVPRQDAPPLKYVITSVDDKWPATDLSVLQPTGHEEMVLLTCTTYNPSDPRIVVFAEPVQ